MSAHFTVKSNRGHTFANLVDILAIVSVDGYTAQCVEDAYVVYATSAECARLRALPWVASVEPFIQPRSPAPPA